MKSINKSPRKTGPLDDNVVIGDEWTREDKPSFICSWCSCTLSKLVDSSGQNPALYCSRCQMSFDPEYDSLRKESKITVPDRNEETLVATTPGIDNTSVQIHKEPEIKGAFKVLQEKGIKITSYHEEVPK